MRRKCRGNLDRNRPANPSGDLDRNRPAKPSGDLDRNRPANPSGDLDPKCRAKHSEADRVCGPVVSRAVRCVNPGKHQSGALVADYLQRNANDFAGTRVLEIGTGSGLLAAVLHDAGATVVATDISRLAVEAARGNLAGTNVDVRLGDLFDPVAGERFDIIVSNPPYEVGSSLRPRYRSADLLERLAATWREYGDQLVLAFPTDAADQLEQLGFTLTLSERLRSTGRELGIYRSA